MGFSPAGPPAQFLIQQLLGSSDSQVTVTPSKRGFATSSGEIVLRANVTIEETAIDDQVITEHPVEQGAAITDHTYSRPARVILRLGWSLSDPEATGDEYLTKVYQLLLEMQKSGTLLQLFTGKRSYPAVLIESIAQTTDAASENTLYVTVVCREIILVQVQAGTVSNDHSVLANPESNAPVVNTGVKQPILAPGVTPPPK